MQQVRTVSNNEYEFRIREINGEWYISVVSANMPSRQRYIAWRATAHYTRWRGHSHPFTALMWLITRICAETLAFDYAERMADEKENYRGFEYYL
jgi:hypothetical protein